MIADKIKFFTGLGMLLIFTIVLAIIFSPVFDGKNGLKYLDELYNSISKDSAYYIPDVQEDSEEFVGSNVAVTIKMSTAEQAEQTALLYRESGADVTVTDTNLDINGDLGRIIQTSLNDANVMFYNDGAAIREKYGYDERQVLYNWWQSSKKIQDDFEDEKMFDEADFLTRVNERAIEPAYNYYGIEAEDVGERAGVLAFSLIFYVVYTLLYGYALMYILEGWGLKISKLFPFSFMARIRLID